MLDSGQTDGLSILEQGDPAPERDGKPVADDVIATADTYRELIAGLVARRKELGLPQHAVDEIAGLTGAYTSKIECRMRGLGRMSLESLLGALGIRLVLLRTVPHHLRQRRVLGSSCGTVRNGPMPADRAA